MISRSGLLRLLVHATVLELGLCAKPDSKTFGMALGVVCAVIIAIPLLVVAFSQIYKFFGFVKHLQKAMAREELRHCMKDVHPGPKQEKEFEEARKEFSNKQWILAVKKNLPLYNVKIDQIKMSRVRSCVYQIRMLGSHEYSEWEGRGYYYYSGQAEAHQLWMIEWSKFCDRKDDSNMGKLVYEMKLSDFDRSGRFGGNWHYACQHSSAHEGTVHLILQQDKVLGIHLDDVVVQVAPEQPTQNALLNK